MKNNFLNSSFANINSKPSSNSEVLSQILHGEKFKILSKKKNWVKIQTSYDNYVGYIKKDKFYEKFIPKLKIFKVKSKIFVKKNNKFLPSKNYLYFASGISVLNKNKNFIEFKKNRWIKKSDTKSISHQEKNFTKIFKLFLNSKYLWGGKTSDGIDCSALIQIYFYYNRIFFPRDSKDQIKFCKKKSAKKNIKGDIIFWRGHVGVCINNSKFIHAYGPKKKVIIMPTKFTVDLIHKTANLNVKKISNIKNY
tara:strand:+ start:21 stop:773 length:753 start_codon:yes stop_codon:yes gene_type:complete